MKNEYLIFLYDAIKHHVTVTSVTHDAQNVLTLGEASRQKFEIT